MRNNSAKVKYIILFFAAFISVSILPKIHTVLADVNGPLFEEYDRKTQNIYINDLKQGAQDLYDFTKEISNQNNIVPTSSRISQTPAVIRPSSPSEANNNSPIESHTNEALYADRVAELVHKNCISNGVLGIVTRLNRNCLDSLKNGVMKNSEIAELKQSPIDNDFLQCVPCARTMSKATGGKYNGYGDAKTHIGKKVDGYQYISMQSMLTNNQYKNNNITKIVPGSLFVVNTGVYGHIGYVTEAMKDENGQPVAFKAFECNLQKNGYVSHERILSIYAVTGFQVPI